MNELTGSKGCLATDTRSLREIAPLLENYFGITLGYFTNEIESSTGISAAKAIQEEHEIRLPTNRFDYDAYTSNGAMCMGTYGWLKQNGSTASTGMSVKSAMPARQPYMSV